MSYDINQLINNLVGEEGVEKQASEAQEAQAPTVADELRDALMTKSASEKASEAEDLGRQLARRLLEKSASAEAAPLANEQLAGLEASVTETLEKEAGVEVQPDVAKAENAANAQEQATVDAVAQQSGGTVEAQAHESIEKGLSTGTAVASSEDQVRKVEDQHEDADMQKAAAVAALVEGGDDFYEAFEKVAMADAELQKEAAFNQLISEGYSFEDAAGLVKAACEFPQSEEFEKAAALGELLSEGFVFDEAVELIKEAGLGSTLRSAGSAIRREVGAVKSTVQASRGIGKVNPKLGRRVLKDGLTESATRNAKPLAAVGAAAVGAGAAAGMSKQAAFEQLLEQGYTFDQALDAVQG